MLTGFCCYSQLANVAGCSGLCLFNLGIWVLYWIGLPIAKEITWKIKIERKLNRISHLKMHNRERLLWPVALGTDAHGCKLFRIRTHCNSTFFWLELPHNFGAEFQLGSAENPLADVFGLWDLLSRAGRTSRQCEMTASAVYALDQLPTSSWLSVL